MIGRDNHTSRYVIFLALWCKISNSPRDVEGEDQFTWQCTIDLIQLHDEEALIIQFNGNTNKLKINPMWRPKIEPK